MRLTERIKNLFQKPDTVTINGEVIDGKLLMSVPADDLSKLDPDAQILFRDDNRWKPNEMTNIIKLREERNSANIDSNGPSSEPPPSTQS